MPGRNGRKPASPRAPDLTGARRHTDMRAPILLVHDTDDDVAAPSQARAFADAYGPQARLIETTGLGHRRILADPEVIASAVEFVMSETLARRV
ncbi:alpha/beta hydrolase [Streptomyces sp. NRRL F-2580]|uniref:alpha/beta hydrolase n=1 Tax=Streptomyces sp. NRRL F-2580 TaxID=1463841 RepID=UPI00131B23DD|nr:alpha/beta hydrolase [Streptomyces sp. NRRL F-2580]